MTPEMQEILHISNATTEACGGLGAISLRDWFAGQALAGMLANGYATDRVAGFAYGVAGAMLEVRNKKK